MRTPLIALAVAGLVASTAAAVDFDVNLDDPTLDDVSSGVSSVDSCTEGVTLDLVTGDYDADADDWPVTGVTIANATDGVSLGDVCQGFTLTAVLEGTGIEPLELGSTVIDAGLDLIDLTTEGTPTYVGQVEQTAILIDGTPADTTDGPGGDSGGVIPTEASPEDRDTSIDGTGLGGSYYANNAYTGVSQVFAPSVTGSLYAVDTWAYGAERQVTLQIVQGSDPTGTVLHSQPAPLGGSVGASDFKQVVLDTPVPVVAGQQYTFILIGDINGTNAVQDGGTDHQFQWNNFSWNGYSGTLSFGTYISPVG